MLMVWFVNIVVVHVGIDCTLAYMCGVDIAVGVGVGIVGVGVGVGIGIVGVGVGGGVQVVGVLDQITNFVKQCYFEQ